MVTPEELMEEEEYEDILEDIKEECNKYGVVRSVEIPRPIEGVDVPGCGKVRSKYSTLFNILCYYTREASLLKPLVIDILCSVAGIR